MTKTRRDLTPKRLSKGGLRPKPQTANIKVIVRIRPPNLRENGEQHRNIIRYCDSQTLRFDPDEEYLPFFYHGVEQRRRDLLKKQHKNLTFSFDRVFREESENVEVFEHSTKHLIDILMKGCNCSVFVYGATGAGKTFTMLGKPDNPGITVLTIKELFCRKEELQVERDFQLYVTYLEVYNETVRDLLMPGSPLQLREDSQFRVRVANLTHMKIADAEELFSLLEKGNLKRTQHPTDSNSESSRSHAVFQVYLQMTMKTTGQTIVAKLSMIDLAGSERGAATGCKGMRFTEGANINKSLLALGNCINSLADGHKHVPYRNSKLTRILKDSLGGNCHTVMIANVSPSSFCFEDTYNTLKYANRAKKIKLTVKKNIVNNEKSAAQYINIIEELNNDKNLLREELESANRKYNELEATHALCKMDPVSTILPYDNDKHIQLNSFFKTYLELEERLQQMNAKKVLLEMRIKFKSEANCRLSDLSWRTECDDDHKRLIETINRMQRQVIPYNTEIEDFESSIASIRERIKELIKDDARLEAFAASEQMKIDQIKTNHKIEMLEAVYKSQSSELLFLNVQSKMTCNIMKPWYLLLKSRHVMTDDMEQSFDDVRSNLLSHGHANVTFENTCDSGVSASSSSSSARSNTEYLDEPRTIKRKLVVSTEQIATTSAKTKGAQVGSLFKEHQPTPAKRIAKSRPIPSNRQNVGAFKPGTMGTSLRFPPNKSTKPARGPFR